MSGKQQKIPKDHYVPQFYLDAFAIEGPSARTPHIYQYMLDKIVSPRIKDVASERHFYSVKEKETGNTIRDIDNFYTKIESLAAGPLSKIIKNEEIKLEDNELANLAIFIAGLAVRTPGFINGMQSMEEEAMKEFMALDALDIDRFRKSYQKAGIILNEKELIEQQKFVVGKQYSVDFGNKGYFLANGLELSTELAQWYYEKKHWHLLVCDTSRVFLTSDNPISIYRPVHVPPIMSAGYGNGTLLMPLSPKLALLLRDFPHKNSKIIISRKMVEKLNAHTMSFSNNYIFSNIKSKQIHETYLRVGNKKHQQTTVKRHNFAPYVFMSPPPVPQEPLF